MLFRSSDNTVVGLNEPTMQKVEVVESLMRSPDPAEGAKALERVVAAKVTPQTTPEDESSEDLEAWFAELEEKIRR